LVGKFGSRVIPRRPVPVVVDLPRQVREIVGLFRLMLG
jgi:hypothetical protein